MVLRREMEVQKAGRDVPKSSHSSEFALFNVYLKITNNILNTPSHWTVTIWKIKQHVHTSKVECLFSLLSWLPHMWSWKCFTIYGIGLLWGLICRYTFNISLRNFLNYYFYYLPKTEKRAIRSALISKCNQWLSETQGLNTEHGKALVYSQFGGLISSIVLKVRTVVLTLQFYHFLCDFRGRICFFWISVSSSVNWGKQCLPYRDIKLIKVNNDFKHLAY